MWCFAGIHKLLWLHRVEYDMANTKPLLDVIPLRKPGNTFVLYGGSFFMDLELIQCTFTIIVGQKSKLFDATDFLSTNYD